MNLAAASTPRSRILLVLVILALPLLPSIVLRSVRIVQSWTLGSTPLFSSSFYGARRLHTPTMAYEKELLVAQLAVQRAARLTKRVFHEQAKGTQSKDDKSPVTFGDYGAQALIIHALKSNFPDDEVVGEEDADDLRKNTTLSNQIWQMVSETRLLDDEAEKTLGGPIPSEQAMLDVIDQGNSQGGRKGRIWALDPIDGTLGFLRGGQYAVCLALMVDGVPTVGVLGCPNLPVDDSKPLDQNAGEKATDGEGYGVLFSAIAGQGATSRPLTGAGIQPGKPIHMNKLTSAADLTNATFCESVEAKHSNHSQQGAIASRLGITRPSVRMDSQAKYASVSRGAGDIYLRLPSSRTYVEKIWDHAAGELIVREAGGVVTDVHGKRLDFGLGRLLKENTGVVAAPKDVHATVLEAVQAVLASSN